MDALVWQARDFHRLAVEVSGQARQYRERRDSIIRRLYASGDFTYSTLAKQVGCSPELVAKAVQGR